MIRHLEWMPHHRWWLLRKHREYNLLGGTRSHEKILPTLGGMSSHEKILHTSSTHARAFLVDPSASIAEIFTAPAFHVITPLRLFNPELTEWTLLVLSSFDEFFEKLICLIWVLRCLELFAGHILVKLTTAREAVSFLALGTVVVIAILPLLVHEGILAIGSRTP